MASSFISSIVAAFFTLNSRNLLLLLGVVGFVVAMSSSFAASTEARSVRFAFANGEADEVVVRHARSKESSAQRVDRIISQLGPDGKGDVSSSDTKFATKFLSAAGKEGAKLNQNNWNRVATLADRSAKKLEGMKADAQKSSN